MPTIKEITQYFSRVEEHGLWVMVHFKLNSTNFLRGVGFPLVTKFLIIRTLIPKLFIKKNYSEINKHFLGDWGPPPHLENAKNAMLS